MILYKSFIKAKLKSHIEIYEAAKEIGSVDNIDVESYLNFRGKILAIKISELEHKLESVHRFICENSNLILKDESLMELINKVYCEYKSMSEGYETQGDDLLENLMCELWFHHKNRLIPLLENLKENSKYILSIRSVFDDTENSSIVNNRILINSLTDDEVSMLVNEYLRYDNYHYKEIALYYYYNDIEIGQNDKCIAKKHNIKDARYLHRCFEDMKKKEWRFNRDFGKYLERISPFLFDEARERAKMDAVLYEKEWNKPVEFMGLETFLNIK
jgi:hypothetical protein